MFPTCRGHRAEPAIKHRFHTFPRGSACLGARVYGLTSAWGQHEQDTVAEGVHHLLMGLLCLSVTHQDGTSWEMGEGQVLPCTYSLCNQSLSRTGFWFQMGFRWFSLQNRFHSMGLLAEQEESQWLAKCKNIWMHLVIHLLTRSFNT